MKLSLMLLFALASAGAQQPVVCNCAPGDALCYKACFNLQQALTPVSDPLNIPAVDWPFCCKACLFLQQAPAPVPDHIYVPATDWPVLIHPAGEYWVDGMNISTTTEDIYEMRPGCDDKHRILEHDQQTPPKWWCRKVQP